MSFTNVDRDQAYREIQELVSRGIVSPPGRPGRGAMYRVNAELRRELRWRERRLPEIRAHFGRMDRLTNRDYRGLFDLPRGAAKKELRELTERRLLELRGQRRGAHYVPGPAFGET